jgi:hypothetical protein
MKRGSGRLAPMPTRLYFGKEDSLVVDQEIEAVESAFRTAPPNPAPLVELTERDQRVLVNVTLVRYFVEHRRGTARVVSG